MTSESSGSWISTRLEMKTTFETLTSLGKDPLRLDKTLVLPFGGRIMGLYPQPGLNALWVNPALGAAASAHALLTGGGWTNLGGDRTWISPEFDLFVSDASRPGETYKVPAGFDPGHYRVVSQSANAVELETAAVVDFYRSGCKGRLSLRKRITELAAFDFTLPAGVSAAGYELVSTLSADRTLPALPASARPALWNLLQVAGGGEIVIPFKGAASPVAYFGKQQGRQDGQRLVASVPAARESYKFGMMADQCRGLMLYLNLAAPQPFVIVRRFSVGSTEQYFDAPFTEQQRRGVVQQVYVDNGDLGGFGEMEHHSPAMIPGLCSEVKDICTTWAFAGPADHLRELTERVTSWTLQ